MLAFISNRRIAVFKDIIYHCYLQTCLPRHPACTSKFTIYNYRNTHKAWIIWPFVTLISPTVEGNYSKKIPREAGTVQKGKRKNRKKRSVKNRIPQVQPIVKHRVSFHLSIRLYQNRAAVLNSREWNEQCCHFAEVFWRRRKARHPLTESRNYFVTATTMPIEANRSALDRPQQFRSFSFVEEQ